MLRQFRMECPFNTLNIIEYMKAKKEDQYNLYMQNQAAKLINKDKEISVLIKQNKMLRQQVDELKKQLEVAYAAVYKKGD